ncbi:MAG: UPF0149 family protein [Gammaproteobacteria bacterium]
MLYIEFDNMLAHISNKAADASESHGNLIGLYSAKPESAVPDWLAALTADSGADSATAGGEIAEVAQRLVGNLNTSDLSFQLLLPDDETPLPERVQALAHWCQGYLYGLAQGGVQQFEGLPGDCAEILNDFAELTKARSDDESEGSERDFFELSEYVRVGAQLIFEELTEVSSTATTQKH